jgi:hypothetical protein
MYVSVRVYVPPERQMCDPVLVSEIAHLHAFNTGEVGDVGVIQAKM